MIKVLVTSVGSGVGQSVVDSLNLKRDYIIVGCNSTRDVFAFSCCDSFYLVSNFHSEGYLDEIIALCIANEIDIVVPGHDQELTLFAKNKAVFEKNNIKVLVSEPTIIEISRDKQDWYNYFAPKGCNIVPTTSVKEFTQNIDKSIFPAIVKPSGGSASQGISIVNTEKDLEVLKPQDIIQPYLFPEKEDPNYEAIVKAVANGNFIQKSEISIQLLFNNSSKYKAIFISKNTLKNGVPIFVDAIEPKEFKYLDEILKFVPILEQKKVKGPVNIQGRITPKGLFFFEMNMRFTGITGNRAQLGFNEVDYLIRNFLNKPAKISGFSKNKLGVRQVACTTIPRPNSSENPKTLTLLGAGSTVAKCYIKTLNLNEFNKIFIVTRKASIQKYKNLFRSSVFEIIEDNDNSLTTCFMQTDVLINFVSALAFESDALKFDAVRYIYNMIPKIAKANISKIINISSQSVYCQTTDAIKNEQANTSIQSSYAFQKLMIEDFFNSVNQYSVLTKVINLRCSRILNVNDQNQIGFFGTIVSNYIEEKETVISYPKNNTNLIHIDDVCDAINFVLHSDINNETLNVGSQNISMYDFAQEIINQLPSHKNTIVFGDKTTVQSSAMINSDKIAALGWQPKKSIKDIIKQIINSTLEN